MQQSRNFLLLFTISVFIVPEYALAYIGPGAGLAAIGTVIALVGAVLLALFGFVWYPIKRLLSWKKVKSGKEGQKIDDDENKDDAKEEKNGDSIV